MRKEPRKKTERAGANAGDVAAHGNRVDQGWKGHWDGMMHQ